MLSNILTCYTTVQIRSASGGACAPVDGAVPGTGPGLVRKVVEHFGNLSDATQPNSEMATRP
jgi:hypothetical protein